MARTNHATAMVEKIIHLRYSMLGLLWVAVVLGFAGTYFALAEWVPHHGPVPISGENALTRFGNSVYFSVVTSTTVGYGDITPRGISKFLAGIESLFALLIFTVGISKLATSKQEIALRQIHRLTFEDVFRSSREGLYIARKDIDHAISAVERGEFGKHHQENIAVACKQVRTVITEIPDFYSKDPELYTIDAPREQLLQEAVHRTLHRINQFLDALSARSGQWAQDKEEFNELQSLAAAVEDVIKQWKTKSPYGKHEAFEDILVQGRHMHEKMQRAVA